MSDMDDVVTYSPEAEIKQADINQTETSQHSSPLPVLSSANLELDDIVVVYSSNGSFQLARVTELKSESVEVIYFLGPKYTYSPKGPKQYVKVEEIILALDKMISGKSKPYMVSNLDLRCTCDHLLRKRILNEKIADGDPIAVELNLIQNELNLFGRTKKNRLDLLKQMQEKLLGNELKTENGLTIAIKHVEENTLNISYDDIVEALIRHAQRILATDSNESVKELASFVARVCILGKSFVHLASAIHGEHRPNIDVFFDECLKALALLFANDPAQLDDLSFRSNYCQLIADYTAAVVNRSRP